MRTTKKETAGWMKKVHLCLLTEKNEHIGKCAIEKERTQKIGALQNVLIEFSRIKIPIAMATNVNTYVT